MADDFLDAKLKELRARLDELRPLHDEYLRIEAALETLEGGAPVAPRKGKRGPGRPRGSGGGGRRGGRRRRRGGTRAEHAARVVREKPGVTVPEIAEQLGIQPNYVYRVMAGLQSDGVVKKKGKGYHPAG